jgi:hypothetical protein
MSAVDDFLAVPDKPDYEAIGTAAGLPKGLFPRVIATESGGRPYAVSNLKSDPAVGASQVRGATAKQYGGNPWDPATGAKVLADYIKKGGSVEAGLAMYNTGRPDTKSAAAKKYIAQVGYVPEDPKDAFLTSSIQQQSPLAKAPPQASAPQLAQQQPAQQPARPSPTILDAMARPADRTVELMQQSSEQTLASIKAAVQHPGVKTATTAALNMLGLPFAPVTSVIDAFLGDPAVQLAHQLGASPKTDPYVRAAAQMVLPVAGARSAMIKEALGAEGQFLAGALSPGAPPLKPGQSATVIAKNLVAHDQQAIARDVQMRQQRDSFLKANPDYKMHDEEIYHAMEDPTKTLTPRAQYLKDTFLDPVLRSNQRNLVALQKLGVNVPALVDPKTYAHRMPIPQKPSQNLLQRIANTVDPTGALSNVAPTKGFGVKPEIFQTPHAGTVKSALTGEEGGYVINPEKDTVDIYKNGKVIDQGQILKGQIVTKNGGVWDMARGTTAQVEQHTPVRYQKSAMASALETNAQLRDAVANAKFMQGMKTSPEFMQLARPPQTAAPEGWKQVTIPGYHGLDDWKMNPHLAQVLEDYTREKQDPNQLLQGINRIVQGSIFINPMGHILNVQWHAAVDAGLFGGVTRTLEGGVRALTPGEKTMTRRAIESVINHDADYLRYVKESPGMKGANNYIRNFSDETLKLMGKNPSALDSSARIFGLKQGADLLRMVYSASNKTLWGVGDMILMKAFLQREAETGMSAAQVAEHTHAHIPDYVIPHRVLGIRGVSQLMQSPVALGFSRYEYNRLESYANLMKGVVQPGPGGTRGEAMDQVAALIFHAAVTYPMMDYAVQKATGNPNATFHGYGPFIFSENLNQYGKGEKTFGQAAVQSIARPSAGVSTAMELYQNRDWKNKPIYGHGGKFMEYVASKTYPTAALYRLVHPPKGVNGKQAINQFALEQFGIKSPTPQQEAVIKKYAAMELKKRKTDKP